MFTAADIDRIVTMTKSQWERYIAALELVERTAYSNYHGVTPAHAYGTHSPQAFGLGGFVGGFRGQESWKTAKSAVQFARRVREGLHDAWQYAEAPHGEAAFVYRFAGTDIRGGDGVMGGTHCVILPTYGVDVSACKSPTEAIIVIQAAVMPCR